MSDETDIQAELEITWRALIDTLGGMEILRATDQHFGEGVSVAQLSEWYGIPGSTLHRRMTRMRTTLMSYGLDPKTWKRQKPGRPSGRTVNADEYVISNYGMNRR